MPFVRFVANGRGSFLTQVEHAQRPFAPPLADGSDASSQLEEQPCSA